jgi:CheY-like chemotaxis protein
MSGPQVLSALKQNPVTLPIPVIVLTSLSQKNEARLRQDGAAGFVEKSEFLDNTALLPDAIKNVLKKLRPSAPDPHFVGETNIPGVAASQTRYRLDRPRDTATLISGFTVNTPRTSV